MKDAWKQEAKKNKKVNKINKKPKKVQQKNTNENELNKMYERVLSRPFLFQTSSHSSKQI